MKRLPRLYECSEYAYGGRSGSGKDGQGEADAWAAAVCYVLAPTIFLYVLWALADALRNGKRRLYFLSADGYMMHLIAEHVCRRWQLPLECRYLYLPEQTAFYAGEDSAGAYAYLRQEGLLDGVPYAVVGCGWPAGVRKGLSRLLRGAGHGGQPEEYCFGLYAYGKGISRHSSHAWYFSPEGGKVKKAFFRKELMRCMFCSPEGTVFGYCRQGDRYVPSFSGKESEGREKAEDCARLLRRYAECYTEGCGNGKRKDRKGRNPRLEMEVITILLSFFMGFPSEEERKAFGVWPSGGGSRSSACREDAGRVGRGTA